MYYLLKNTGHWSRTRSQVRHRGLQRDDPGVVHRGGSVVVDVPQVGGQVLKERRKGTCERGGGMPAWMHGIRPGYKAGMVTQGWVLTRRGASLPELNHAAMLIPSPPSKHFRSPMRTCCSLSKGSPPPSPLAGASASEMSRGSSTAVSSTTTVLRNRSVVLRSSEFKAALSVLRDSISDCILAIEAWEESIKTTLREERVSSQAGARDLS